MRKGGGEEVRSVRCMCDVCAAHGDRASVGVDVDAQGSSLREDESHFPLNARVECRAFVLERILVGLRWHAEKAAVFWGPPHDGIPACHLGIEPKTAGWLEQAQPPAQRGS